MCPDLKRNNGLKWRKDGHSRAFCWFITEIVIRKLLWVGLWYLVAFPFGDFTDLLYFFFVNDEAKLSPVS